MVEANYHDPEIMIRSAKEAKELGFSGKMSIHPKQVQIIHSVFNKIDIRKMNEILAAYEANDSGILIDNGKIYEKPHIESIRKKLNIY